MTKRVSSFLEQSVDLDDFDSDDLNEFVSSEDESTLSSLISSLNSQKKAEARRARIKESRRQRALYLERQKELKARQQQERIKAREQQKVTEAHEQQLRAETKTAKEINLCDSRELQAAFEEVDEERNKEWHQALLGLQQNKEVRIPELPIIAELNKLQHRTPSASGYLADTVDYIKFCHRFKASQFTLPPILIVGEPGSGKTHLAKTISGLLKLEHHVIPISEATDGFYLSGLQKGYTSAASGRVTHRLARGKSANPIIVFDELDKVTWLGDANRKPLLPALLQMLEPGTAAEYRDMCLDVSVDLSNISFICTANTLDNIPAPILSRLTVIEMDKPDGKQMKEVAGSIFNRMSDELMEGGCTASFYVADECIPILEKVNPRDIHKIARQIVIKKILDQGLDQDINITPEDLIALTKYLDTEICAKGNTEENTETSLINQLSISSVVH